MHPTELIIVIIGVIVFICVIVFGSMFYMQYGEKKIRVVMDENDEESLTNVLRVCRTSGLLGVDYNDATNVLYMIITVRTASYETYIEQLKQLPRIEVC